MVVTKLFGAGFICIRLNVARAAGDNGYELLREVFYEFGFIREEGYIE